MYLTTIHTLPYAVKHISIGKDSDVSILDQNGVKMSLFFITEKCIGHPDFTRVCEGQVFETTW